MMQKDVVSEPSKNEKNSSDEQFEAIIKEVEEQRLMDIDDLDSDSGSKFSF